MKIRPMGAQLLHTDRQTDGRADGQADRHDEDNCRFCNFAKVHTSGRN